MAFIIKTKKSSEKMYLPMVAIREGVIFPHTETVLTFGRQKSVNAITAAYKSDKQVVLVTQKNSKTHDPKQSDLYSVGIIANIERTLKTDNELNALVRGMKRVRIESVKEEAGYKFAEITEISEIMEDSKEIEALSKHLTSQLKKAVSFGKSVEFLNFMKLMSGVGSSELADQVGSVLDISTKDKQKLLETAVVKNRLKSVIEHLTHELKVLEIERNIASKTQQKFDKSMREAVLRERMKTIQKELGDEVDDDQEILELKKNIKKSGMPKDVVKKASKELKRLSKMSVHNPESSYIRTWLETLIEMPWDKASKDNTTIKKAERQLDKDHYGLKQVKERIVEYLSVLKLKANGRKNQNNEKTSKDKAVPTILCFSGPPGVGKTSIGRSIATSLGREFVKVSLGGMRDEAELRGHRRTYVGAMPGRIVQGIRSAGTKNPVFMLDEIDKIGADFRGDPSAALLEALDPEQNSEFSDHYLEVTFDLSQVIFITTANVLDTIPPALRDRLEIIRFSGYTEDEKYQIAKRHLLEKTLKANGLEKKQVELSAPVLRKIIKNYTKEAGVRNLEREISKVLRKIAKKFAEGQKSKIKVTPTKLSDYLGPEKFLATLAEKKDEVGVSTGLAWTQVGGDILFIEVALMPGKGKVTITGQLGDVMKESAKAAMSYVRSRWEKLEIDKYFYQNTDIHIHVPEGAVPKDGPSAGVTITTALVSALTNRPVKKDFGMTGEITLRGKILEIGGVKEKSIAAHRAGLKHIVLPKGNKKDLVDVPKEVRGDIKFHHTHHMDSLLKLVLA
ncbi:endopeptidase La [Patescibacteria group bacterium]